MKRIVVCCLGILTMPLRLIILLIAGLVWTLILLIGEPRAAVEWVADQFTDSNWRERLHSMLFGFGEDASVSEPSDPRKSRAA